MLFCSSHDIIESEMVPENIGSAIIRNKPDLPARSQTGRSIVLWSPFGYHRIRPVEGIPVHILVRSYCKKVFSTDTGVEPSSQVLDILAYLPQGHFLRGACGSVLGLALPSSENPNSEMASNDFGVATSLIGRHFKPSGIIFCQLDIIVNFCHCGICHLSHTII